MPQKKTAPIKPFTDADRKFWADMESRPCGFMIPCDDGSYTRQIGKIVVRESEYANVIIREIDYGYKIARDIQPC